MDSIENKLRIEDGRVMGIYTNFPFKPNKYDGHDHSNLKTCNLYKLLLLEAVLKFKSILQLDNKYVLC